MSLSLNPTSKSCRIKRLKIGITLGDPSGIGPAVVAGALKSTGRIADFTIIGSGYVYRKAGGLQLGAVRPRFIDIDNVRHKAFRFGRIDAEYGRASIEYIDRALGLLSSGDIDCLVTAPISKEAVSLAGNKNFTGHTEYLAEKTGVKNFSMMLLNRCLKFFTVTRHISLRDVSDRVKQRDIINCVILADSALKKLFLVAKPRLVVMALNPHASDGGLFGNEETLVIAPALNKCRNRQVRLDGPLAADAAVGLLKDGLYDCAIAMYHDQAMIPLKLIDRHSGVNLTVGLPFVRTSPLHGTAFDIAGNPRAANPSSFIAAIKLAAKCALNLKRA